MKRLMPVRAAVASCLLFCLLFCSGCQYGVETRDYTAEELEVVGEGVTESGVRLIYRVPKETLYHSPGVLMVNKNGKVHLRFPRVLVGGDQPALDVDSVADSDGSLSVTIPVKPTEDRPVELYLNGEKKLGSWSLAPAE